MKIRHQLTASGILTIGLIVLILVFASRDMNAVVAKVRFVEIGDDLNASLLEMRLAEKNYFLFNEDKALTEIISGVTKAEDTLAQVRPEILRATGPGNVSTLRGYLEEYARIAKETAHSGARDAATEQSLREAGRKLRDFSARLIRAERDDVNRIIAASRRGMFLSFLAILAMAVLAGPIVFFRILKSLRRVVDLAHAISEGRFRHIEGVFPNDELGTVQRAMNAMSDELKSRESELLQSKKLASLGTLTAGVAHEITNPLNNISMLAETFETLYNDLGREQRIEFIHKIGGEVERIRQIVVGLLNFSKPKQADPREARLNDIVSGTMRLVGNMLDVSGIEVELHLAEGLPPIFVDEHQIYQVLVNIVTNAIQAMEELGEGERRLIISTRVGCAPDCLEIEMRDTGKGIPVELLPHVFDPFFSTKGVSGTGLGLSVSYGIIKNHGGRIRAGNAPEGGAVLTVELPVYVKEEDDEHPENHGH
ncbi:MAG: ATP-binding protein [Humidesulfovibrio sp.]|nr:ATP-binding protein [Humidesulfovibrio sp.]